MMGINADPELVQHTETGRLALYYPDEVRLEREDGERLDPSLYGDTYEPISQAEAHEHTREAIDAVADEIATVFQERDLTDAQREELNELTERLNSLNRTLNTLEELNERIGTDDA